MLDLERAKLRKMMFTNGQKGVTKALIKFCTEHDQCEFWVEKLSSCLTALEQRDISAVVSIVELLSRAGMGSFLDWVPKPCANEDAEYAAIVWGALYGLWREKLQPFETYGKLYK